MIIVFRVVVTCYSAVVVWWFLFSLTHWFFVPAVVHLRTVPEIGSTIAIANKLQWMLVVGRIRTVPSVIPGLVTRVLYDAGVLCYQLFTYCSTRVLFLDGLC